MKQRLDEIIVSRGLTDSRTSAQRLILAGKVRVRDCPSPKAGNKFPADIEIEMLCEERFVSRGGEKLEGAFNAFNINVTGLSCIDVGASTGGFTDCLLQHGALRVIAVDVGHNQLHPKLLSDSRVTSIEGFNARNMTLSDLPYTPEFAVCDVSFISLKLILPSILQVIAPGSAVLSLIKPQFEAGRENVGKGGVVRDDNVRREVVETIRKAGESMGLTWIDVCESPIKGPKGNVEYVAYWKKPIPV